MFILHLIPGMNVAGLVLIGLAFADPRPGSSYIPSGGRTELGMGLTMRGTTQCIVQPHSTLA
jgi:hypothetical protein